MADPWVAPDTPAVGPATSAPAPSASKPAPAPGDPPTPVPLGPLTTVDVLDGALRAWKLAPATMTAIAALFVLPAHFLLGVITRDAVEDIGFGESLQEAFTATGAEDVETGIGGDLFLLALVVEGIALAFVTAAVARLVTGWYVGLSTGVGQLATGALRRAWPLVVAWLLVHVVEAVFAVALVVPAIVPMAWFAVVSPVIACEQVGPFRALRRSYRLARPRFGAVLGAVLLVAAVHEAMAAALSSLGALYLELDLPAGWVANTAVGAATALVTIPFVAAAATLLYLDLRVRTEGLDIELAAARRLGPA